MLTESDLAELKQVLLSDLPKLFELLQKTRADLSEERRVSAIFLRQRDAAAQQRDAAVAERDSLRVLLDSAAAGRNEALAQLADARCLVDVSAHEIDGLRTHLRAISAGDGTEPRITHFRPEVAWFADAMERKLRENEHKVDWKKEKSGYLLVRLEEETKELERALISGYEHAVCETTDASMSWRESDARAVLSEAADVANFAMMLADVCRAKVADPGEKK